MVKTKTKNIFKIEREKHLKLLEKRIYSALKGVPREDIRTACNRVGRYISETISKEKKIAKLSRELEQLKRQAK